MGSIVIFIFFTVFFNLNVAEKLNTLNVMHFNAVGDGKADDSEAFTKAWEVLCQGSEDDTISTTLVIPENKTFLLQHVNFKGPCKSRNLQIQVKGNISAPNSPKKWSSLNNGKKESDHECWLCVSDVDGLSINGPGYIDAKGSAWWNHVPHKKRPRALSFNGCSNLKLNGLTHIDSPKNHISIHNCTNATLSNLHIVAPEDSPNTDGIDISESKHINIFNSSIGTGDDCIAINRGCSNINITTVACGPGHGISVGSLGADGSNDTVENVNVRNCSFNGTQNAARIKTWEGGLGFARGILFEKITLIASKNPIIIDQHYCNGGHDCSTAKTAVKVSNVTFRDFRGTSAEKEAIRLDCSANGGGCDDIVLDQINITSSVAEKKLHAFCNNSQVFVSNFVSPLIPCSHRPSVPSPY